MILHLARPARAEPPASGEVALAVGGPRAEVEVAVGRLRGLGVVAAGAGLTLTDLGRTASVGWLVRELEGVGDVVGCQDDPPCPLLGPCRLRGVLRRAQDAFLATLDPVTVPDLVADARWWLGLPMPSAR